MTSERTSRASASSSASRSRDGRPASASSSASPPLDESRRALPLGRLQRLQVVLLVVLGLWSIESGMQRLDVEPDAEALPAVSSSAADATRDAFAAQGELTSLAGVLGEANPHLAPSERRRIAAAVLRYSAKYALEPDLVTAVLLVESTARPWVRSPKGAVGLMQVMPHMMEPLGLAGNAATIESNIEAGCFILADNINRLGEEQGISSYFWGSDIRGSHYLRKVQAARDEVRRHFAS